MSTTMLVHETYLNQLRLHIIDCGHLFRSPAE